LSFCDIAVVSTPTLERWDWRNPEKGIGGSETSHVRMAQGLHKAGLGVISYAPLPESTPEDKTGLLWAPSEEFRVSDAKIVINYRDPKVFEAEKPAGAKWWFVAQDVDYPWSDQALAKVDRYLVLCPEHARYTQQKYPELHRSGRLFISSNGIDSLGIRNETAEVWRERFRLTYASSPDRGLMLILENWFRIKERVPEAEIHVFYGFKNMETIVQANGAGDWRAAYQARLRQLLNQPGVVWRDRVGQKELWREWAKTNVWFHPTDFPETSCITSMEAQAAGAIPVTNRLWALKSNVLDGYLFDGIPQKSPRVKCEMIEAVVEHLRATDPRAGHSRWDSGWFADPKMSYVKCRRNEMREGALRRFDWANIVEQWTKWIEEDLKG